MKAAKQKKGQAVVELALILPILVLIVMGIIEFGLIMNSYLALNNASREGARIGIVGGTDSQIRSAITNTSASLKADKITVEISPTQANRKSGDTLTVIVSYDYQTIIPLIGDIVNDIVKLKAEISMRVE